MKYVDVHAHLDHPDFKDADDVIKRAKNAGVVSIITNGINPETNRIALKLASKYDIVKAALGIYPVDALAKEIKEGEYPIKPDVFDVDEEIEFISQNVNKCIAIGEIGLDDYHVKGKLAEQKKVFEKLLGVAEKAKKPVLVHTRKAESEALDMLETANVKAVLHCFGGNKKQVQRGADIGCSFSIPPNIVRAQHFQMIVKNVGINYLLTETDAPYLSPYPGERNESAYVPLAVKKIAEIKGFEEEEVANNILLNYQRMFC